MSITSLLISEDVAPKYFSTSIYFRHIQHDTNKLLTYNNVQRCMLFLRLKLSVIGFSSMSGKSEKFQSKLNMQCCDLVVSFEQRDEILFFSYMIIYHLLKSDIVKMRTKSRSSLLIQTMKKVADSEIM
jgi:hypothetical protein